jgi:hypothetical protein
MRLLIPFVDELPDLRMEVVFRVKIDDSQAFPLEDREPLFDLIHPRPMYGRKVHHKARMVDEPFLDFLPMMRTDIVTHELDGADGLVNLRIQRLQKGDEFPLPLAFITVPIDVTRTGVKGGKKMERTSALILVRVPVGNVLRLGWQGWGATRTWLQGGLLVHGADPFIWPQWPGVEVNQLGHGGIEGSVPRLLGIEPDMLAPGFQLMGGQNPAHGGSGDILNDPLGNELPRQFGAIPLRQAATQRIRAFAGQAYHVDRDRGGKTRPWPRGQGRRRAPQGAGRESAWPTYAPPSVGRPPRQPRQTGSAPWPAGG